MIRLFLLLSFSLPLFASDTLAFGQEQEKEQKQESEKIPAYTIQLFSVSDTIAADNLLKEIPKEFQSQTHLYRVGKYIAGRYSQSLSSSDLNPYIEEFHNAGYKDAYIIKSTLWHMKNGLISDDANTQPKEENVEENVVESTQTSAQTPQESQNIQDSPKNTNTNTNTISSFEKSNILLKAQSAYQKGNESEAMIYYEMLLASGYTNQKIKNNLCYLYGKRGAWFEAKTIIDKERSYGKLLYAYAYGAVETRQENYYSDLSPYVMIDKSGSLMLLSGYYFEKNEDMQRAFSFYKMAYEKNPTDVYNIFSFARALDIQEDTKALLLYKNILSKVDNTHPLYAPTYKRIIELGE